MFTGQSEIDFTPGGDRPRGFQDQQFMVDQLLGANLRIPLSVNGGLNLAYIWLDSNDVVDVGTSLAPRLTNGTAVYGAEAKYNWTNWGFNASYNKSDTRYNGRMVNTHDDAAWNAGVHFGSEMKWEFGVGYRRIEPLYAAPGDWGRIGIWWNPTDIKGFYGNAGYTVSPKLRLGIKGGFYSGTDTTDSFGDTGMSNDDKLTHFLAELTYTLCPDARLKLGYESVMWDLKSRPRDDFAGGKPTEQWYNIGVDWDLSKRARLSFLWQISNYNGKNVDGFGPFSNEMQTKATGGLLTTQLTIKF